MDPSSATSRLSAALRELPEVRLAYLFGSRARSEARPDSDFDIAVLIDDEAVSDPAACGRIVRRLAGRLGREVASHRLDLVILNGSSSLLRHRVLRDGVLLVERDPGERLRFATQTIREYQDGQVRRDWFRRERIRKLKQGDSDGGSGDLLEKARSAARLFVEARRLSPGA